MAKKNEVDEWKLVEELVKRLKILPAKSWKPDKSHDSYSTNLRNLNVRLAKTENSWSSSGKDMMDEMVTDTYKEIDYGLVVEQKGKPLLDCHGKEEYTNGFITTRYSDQFGGAIKGTYVVTAEKVEAYLAEKQSKLIQKQQKRLLEMQAKKERTEKIRHEAKLSKLEKALQNC